MTIFWFWHGELNTPNRARYQRIMRVAKRHRVILLNQKRSPVADEIRRLVCQVLSSPGTGTRMGDYLLYYFFIMIWVPILASRYWKERPVIFSCAEFSAVLAFFLSRVLRLCWVIDMLDDPRLDVESLTVEGRSHIIKAVPYRMLLGFFRLFLRRAELVFAVGTSKDNEGIPRSLIEEFSVPAERLVPVPNGTDLAITPLLPDHRRADQFRVTYLGYLSRRRGTDFLLQACALAQQSIPELHLTMAGRFKYAEDRNWLRRMIEQTSMKSHADYAGFLDRQGVMELLAATDVCVFVASPEVTNYRNTMSIKVPEYLAVGRVVVAPDFPGVRQVIMDGWNGLLFDPGDPHHLADQLVKIYRDEDLKRSIESVARKSVEPFDWSCIHEKIVLPAIESAYRDFLTRQSR
jgi:glycosyltransferase involved in cell wall biosynthesis